MSDNSSDNEQSYDGEAMVEEAQQGEESMDATMEEESSDQFKYRPEETTEDDDEMEQFYQQTAEQPSENTADGSDANPEASNDASQLSEGEGSLKRPNEAEEGGEEDGEPPSKKRNNEVEKLWENVNANPGDFQAWTILLQHIDQSNDLESGREAYDGFFARYPYCYGYWKKYADLEKRKGSTETAQKVFNRGLAAIRLSVDLWMHYLDWVMNTYAEEEAFIRQEFERAVENCGLEFKSDKLWDCYINWESSAKRWKNVTLIYERLLAIPTNKYTQHWTKFQEHVRKHLPSEVVSVDEFLSVRREVLAEKGDEAIGDEAPPGEMVPGEGEQKGNDEETKAIQKSIIDTRQKIHDDTANEAKNRWSYEDAIKRPYFHVKPLEKNQLTAWRSYIEYEVKEGNSQRIRVLFERCLIACALYEEFWMKYVKYLQESQADPEDIREVFRRACNIHLRERFKANLLWALFEEEQGCISEALEILGGVKDRLPESLETWMQTAALHRRQEDLDRAQATFEDCLEVCSEKENKDGHGTVSIKYARFLSIVKNDGEKAYDVLNTAHEANRGNFKVLLALIDQALACRPPKTLEAVATLKAACAGAEGVPPQARMAAAQQLYNFMMEFGAKAGCIRDALKVLSDTRAEVRAAAAESGSGEKGGEGAEGVEGGEGGGISVIEGRGKKAGDKAAMNGNAQQNHQQQNFQQGYGQQGQQQQGYNQGYGQGYGQGYQGYQNWGYPAQQGSYAGAYQQQGWGNYGNYYGTGQR